MTHHVLIDRRWRSKLLDLLSFRGSDCDTGHCLMVAKVRERLEINKQGAQKSGVERFNLKMLSEQENRNHIRMRFQKGLQLWRT